jgi:hypothetical protein
MGDEVKPAYELEQEARAVNAMPWEPLPGMVKKRCLRCHYWFAVKAEEAETTATYPTAYRHSGLTSGSRLHNRKF